MFKKAAAEAGITGHNLKLDGRRRMKIRENSEKNGKCACPTIENGEERGIFSRTVIPFFNPET